jgi:membrane protease YdiL (CAAX protease family)
MTGPLTIAVVVLVIWTIIVFGGERLQTGEDEGIQDLISKQFLYTLAIAPIFLLAVVAYEGWWREVGLETSKGVVDKLLIVPALVVIFIWCLTCTREFLKGKRLAVAGANTFLVGLSEELMFRGILLYALQSVLSAKWAVVVTALSFGAIHILNGLITGKPQQALLQAFFASLFGFWTAALRMRIESIIPLIVIHWLWDFGLAAAPESGQAAKTFSWKKILPLASDVVMFGYGVWLMFG